MMTEETSVSCGVDMLYGFEGHRDCDIEDIAQSVINCLAWDMYQLNNSTAAGTDPACRMYVFSDIADMEGDMFAEWLRETLDAELVNMRGVNPNSGNEISTYIWRVDTRKLRTTPLWKEAQRFVRTKKKEHDSWRF